MRSLLLSLLGIAALSVAFVAPGDARSLEDAARVRAALMTGADPSLRTWSVSEAPVVPLGAPWSLQRITTAMGHAVGAQGEQEFVRSASSIPAAGWHTFVTQVKDPAVRGMMQVIENAVQKKSPAACASIDAVVTGVFPEGFSKGDVLALCVARVTRDAARCASIDSDASPMLRHLCALELERPSIDDPVLDAFPYTSPV